jgi:hypothetical protein
MSRDSMASIPLVSKFSKHRPNQAFLQNLDPALIFPSEVQGAGAQFWGSGSLSIPSSIAEAVCDIRDLDGLVSRGRRHVNQIYFHRSVSKAIPTGDPPGDKEDREHPLATASPEEREELKKNIHKVAHGILKPLYDMVKEIIDFTKAATSHLVHLAKEHRDSAPSSEFLGGTGCWPELKILKTIELFDILGTIDEMKMLKPSLTNDMSRYKRCCASLPGNSMSAEETQSLMEASMFIAESNKVIFEVVKQFSDTFGKGGPIDMVNFLLDWSWHTLETLKSHPEQLPFLSPKHEFMLVRFIPRALSVVMREFHKVDPELKTPEQQAKDLKSFMDKNPSVKSSLQVLKEWDVVPLVGDVPLAPSRILMRYDWGALLRSQNSGIFAMTPDDFMSLDDARRQKSVPDKFSLNPTTNKSAVKISDVRASHSRTLARLFSLKSSLGSAIRNTPFKIPTPILDDLVQQLTRETERAVLLMRGWYCKLMLVNAWKHSHPYGLRQLALEFPGVCEANNTTLQEQFEQNKRDLTLTRTALSKLHVGTAERLTDSASKAKVKKRRNMDYTPFEDAIAFNFSDDERVVVIELVSCIKDVACALLDAEFVSFAKEISRQHVFAQLQEFALNFLTHPIRRAKKHKKEKALTFLLQMRSLVAEWSGCEDSPGLPEVKGDKDKGAPRKIADDHPPLIPSATQMNLLVYMLELLINRHAHEKAGLFHKDEVQGEASKEFQRISALVHSAFNVFNIQESVSCVSNLTDLWLHEYWLDLCQTSKDSRVPEGGSASQKTDALAFFPLRLSLPGSLLLAIERKKVQFCDMQYHVLSVYSDIAASCLSDRFPSFVFNEAKLEARLALFNIMRSQKRRIWTVARIQAFGSMLPLEFKSLQVSAKDAKGFAKWFNPQASPVLRTGSIRIVSVLGVQVDVHAMVGTLLSEMIQSQLKRGLKVLEKKGLIGILEFKAMVSALRIMHEAIVAASFSLPPFQTYFSIATDSTSPSSFISKLVKIMIISIAGDILPNFIFDSVTCTFRRAPGMEKPSLDGGPYVALPAGPDLEKKLDRARSAEEAQITRAHVNAMMELCGLQVPYLFHKLREYFETCLATLGEYVLALQEAFKGVKVATYTRAQMEQFGKNIAFVQLRSTLKPVLEYGDLQSQDGIMYVSVNYCIPCFVMVCAGANSPKSAIYSPLPTSWTPPLLFQVPFFAPAIRSLYSEPLSSGVLDTNLARGVLTDMNVKMEENLDLTTEPPLSKAIQASIEPSQAAMGLDIDKSALLDLKSIAIQGAHIMNQRMNPLYLATGMLGIISQFFNPQSSSEKHRQQTESMMGGIGVDGVPGGVIPDMQYSSEFWRVSLCVNPFHVVFPSCHLGVERDFVRIQLAAQASRRRNGFGSRSW